MDDAAYQWNDWTTLNYVELMWRMWHMMINDARNARKANYARKANHAKENEKRKENVKSVW